MRKKHKFRGERVKNEKGEEEEAEQGSVNGGKREKRD